MGDRSQRTASESDGWDLKRTGHPITSGGSRSSGCFCIWSLIYITYLPSCENGEDRVYFWLHWSTVMPGNDCKRCAMHDLCMPTTSGHRGIVRYRLVRSWDYI
jgi:hypothetical protein